MQSPAYSLGVELALQEMGLVKAAGPVMKGVTSIGRDVARKVKDFGTFAKVRSALEALGKPTPPQGLSRGELYKQLGQALRPYGLAVGGTGAAVGGYHGLKKLFPDAFGS